MSFSQTNVCWPHISLAVISHEPIHVGLDVCFIQFERVEWYWTPYQDDSVRVVLRELVANDTPVTGCWPEDASEKVG